MQPVPKAQLVLPVAQLVLLVLMVRLELRVLPVLLAPLVQRVRLALQARVALLDLPDLKVIPVALQEPLVLLV